MSFQGLPEKQVPRDTSMIFQQCIALFANELKQQYVFFDSLFLPHKYCNLWYVFAPVLPYADPGSSGRANT